MIGNLLSDLQHHVSSLRGSLRGAWKLWRVWCDSELPARAPLLDRSTVLALRYCMMTWDFPEAAVLTCIAFHGFLRTSEYINLRVSQVIFDRLVTQAHLQFPESKGAARRGVVESVHITDAQLIKLLRKCMAGKQMSDNILPQTPAQYRELFALACHALSLDTEFKPYSLRRGGATELRHAQHGSM